MGPLAPGTHSVGADPHQVGRCFDQLAEAHELATDIGMSTAVDRWVAQTLESLAQPTGTCLIMGAGTGREALPLVAAGWSVLMIDVSAGMVVRARQRFGGHPAATVVQADIEAWLSSHASPMFDAAIAVGEVISYLAHPETLLPATAKLLRPGAWLLMTYMEADVLGRLLAATEPTTPTTFGLSLVERRGLAAGELCCQAFAEDVVDRWALAAGLIRAACAPPGHPRAGRVFLMPAAPAGQEAGLA